MLAARGGRIGWASVMIVGAVVAKQWAVIAIVPAAMAAPRGGWKIAFAGRPAPRSCSRCRPAGAGPCTATITNTGTLFHPHQLFWPFGIQATPEFIEAGHGTRMGPAWLAPLTRPMIVGAAVVVAVAWWLRSGPDRNRDDVLGVLALALLLRCMLDPWDLVYYHLPLTVALVAWEARRGRDLPVLAVGTTAAVWFSFVIYDERTGTGPTWSTWRGRCRWRPASPSRCCVRSRPAARHSRRGLPRPSPA